MPARRLLMRKIREVLRLRHEQGLSHREIAQSCFIGAGTVSRYLQKTAARGLGWPLPTELDDAVLEGQLFRRAAPAHDRARPDCAYIHRELKRDGVTLQLLWEEYALVHPQGYRRTQFCALYQQWARRLRPSMRQVHRAGEKTFLDFSGKRPTLIDGRTAPVTRSPVPVSGACFGLANSPWLRPFPPATPQAFARPCSPPSSVLLPHPTSSFRPSSVTESSFPLRPRFDCRGGMKTSQVPAKDVRTCLGSLTPWSPPSPHPSR